MIFKDLFNKISVPFTSPLSVTVGHERIRFQGEGHRSIADRRLHMLVSKQAFLGGLCSEWNMFLRAVGARCARSVNFFHELISFAKMVNLF